MGAQPQDDGAWPAVHQDNAPIKREEIKTEYEPSQEFRERLEEANNVLRQCQRSEGRVFGAGAAAAAPVRAIKPEPTNAPMPTPGTVNDAGVAKHEDGGIPKLPSIKPEPEDAPMPPPHASSAPRYEFRLTRRAVKPLAKPEPVDVPMPRPRALNKCMDPFEPEGTPSIGVKQEAGREFNTRQPLPGTVNPPSAYLRAPTPRIKQEEPRQQSVRVGRQEYGYGGNVNRGRSPSEFAAPAPIAFPRAIPINCQTPAPHNYSAPAREDTRGYSRQSSRTFSPPPRPVKRERDADDDSRPYRPANEPPVKRERSESTAIRFNYSASPDPPDESWTRWRERDVSKRTKTE
ncbi:hypothetical protein B0H17DRAFT_1086750 [Mycena rosella]|uniref:Uncharacterized protein n=1 Tax=Mycena rosella TaxID=1033263 RepID=A0AAD7G5E4_MYCRO|nr:hypothetical protein B0H17DRAFT_1086750 [Mycena rosella]